MKYEDRIESVLNEVDSVNRRGPFAPSWSSLSAYQIPEWYSALKFGIFIHWGVYSVPAFGNEWYPRNMYMKDSQEYRHHLETYGSHSKFGYKEFIPKFRAENFDPEVWADLFVKAGARYVVPVAEHHDGFQMYASELSHWNAYEMGPRRDVLGEITAACSERGLVTGASSHRIEHWFFMGHGREFDSDIRGDLTPEDLYWPAMPEPDFYALDSKPAPSEQFLQDWTARTCELIDHYQPKILYFDWWIQHESAKPYLRKIAAYYYNKAEEWETGAVINYKNDAFPFGAAVPDMERGQFETAQPFVWQSDTSVALNSWGYTEGNKYRTAESLLCDLIDIVSKNGCMLLNIGPKSDGTIPEEDERILLQMGSWLSTNGEAIYGTRPWRTFGEGPTHISGGQFKEDESREYTSRDFRFTAGNGCIYAIAMKCSESGEYCITSLGEGEASLNLSFHGVIREVQLQGTDMLVEWKRDNCGLHIKASYQSEYPLVFKIVTD